MKKFAALILAIILAAAVSLAGADSLELVPGTAAECTVDIFQTYFDMISAAAGYDFTWDEAPVTEDGYDVYVAHAGEGMLEMKLYTQEGKFCYVVGAGSGSFATTDSSAANTFGTWFGATLGGTLISLKIGEEGLSAIADENLQTELQSAITPLEPILLSAFLSEENLAKGAAGSVTALGYPIGIEINGAIDGDQISVNMKVIVTSKDGQLNVKE